MARVVDLEAARVAQLAAELAGHLTAVGEVRARVADLEDVERWRRAARKAGRIAGWKVRTATSVDGSAVWAIAIDRQATQAELRDAAERLGRALGLPPSPPQGGRSRRW
jgi:hypothetical protein